MSSQERYALTCAWNALCVLASIYYLTGSLFKAGIIAGFVYLSSLLSYGARWLFRGGLLVTLLACLVFVGFPSPEYWPGMIKSALESFYQLRPVVR